MRYFALVLMPAAFDSSPAQPPPESPLFAGPAAYPFRGLLLDVARQYHSLEGIRQVVELCRLARLDRLVLALSCDELFMFGSEAFPELGRGNRELTAFAPPSRKPPIPPYTKAELRELDAFARARGVAIVPLVDLPGHATRLCADRPDVFRADPAIASTIDLASPESLDGARKLLGELCDVFTTTDCVHLGADEVDLSGFDRLPRVQAEVRRLGLRHAGDLFRRFIAEMHAFLNGRGRETIVWEGFPPDPESPVAIPKDVIVAVWTGDSHAPDRLLEAGHRLINASWTPLYLVRQDRWPAAAILGWDPAKFGPHSRSFPERGYTEVRAGPGRILGGLLCAWEQSGCFEIQSLRERAGALGARLWNPARAWTPEAFRAAWAPLDAGLERRVHPVTIRAEGRLTDGESAFEDALTISLDPSGGGVPDRASIRYTLDNSEPGPESARYEAPFRIADTVFLRAGVFDGAGRRIGPFSGAWFRRVARCEPNLATGRPVTATAHDPGFGPELAVDGRADDVWKHWSAKAPASLTVDLGEVRELRSVNVLTFHDGSRSYQFTVDASADGADWLRIADFSENRAPASPSGYEAAVPGTKARYVRVNMLKNSANEGVHILELSVR